MGAEHAAVWLDIPAGLSDSEKVELGDAYIEYIYQRTTKRNVDKNGEPFPEYSDAYVESLDFKNMGKSKQVNLKLSGDMLAEMKILAYEDDRIQIGYDMGSTENGKADGNIRGTYGKDEPNPSKARDFLGFDGKELKAKARIDLQYARNKPSSQGEREAVSSLSKDFKFKALSGLQAKGIVDGRLNLKNKTDAELEELYLSYYTKNKTRRKLK